MRLTVNERAYEITHPDEPLVWILRDELGLTGTRYGCGIGLCGCCTVLADGEPIRSCQTTATEVAQRRITTLEGLADGDQLNPVQQAFLDNPLQCGWCLPGHVLTATALIATNPAPTEEQIEASAGVNLCRCGGYNTIRANVTRAAEIARERG